MQKWDFKKKIYKDYKINSDWFTPLYLEDMDAEINCADCGKEITFGKSYTSKAIHNKFGLGYPVCSKCYEKELKKDGIIFNN